MKDRGRIWLIDAWRSLALLCMATFHFTFDLRMFGLWQPGPGAALFLYYYARMIAGSFLFIAGMGLWLSHGQGIRWPAFRRRALILAASAAAVTLATWIVMPDWFIFFGILHSILVASLLGLLFLPLPGAVTLALGIGVVVASYILPPLYPLNGPWLRWLGMQTLPTASVDLEPLLPWFGPFLAGIGVAKLLGPVWPRLATVPARQTPLLRALAWPGQHSLAIYLIHQPVLFGLVWAWVWLHGAI